MKNHNTKISDDRERLAEYARCNAATAALFNAPMPTVQRIPVVMDDADANRAEVLRLQNKIARMQTELDRIANREETFGYKDAFEMCKLIAAEALQASR